MVALEPPLTGGADIVALVFLFDMSCVQGALTLVDAIGEAKANQKGRTRRGTCGRCHSFEGQQQISLTINYD